MSQRLVPRTDIPNPVTIAWESTIAQAAPPPALDDTGTLDEVASERPLFDIFAAVAARQPDHLAVDDETTRLSYAELRDRALALGARIAALVPADGLIGVLVPSNVLYPVAWLACLAARRAFRPLDLHLPPARARAIVDQARLAAIIVPSATEDPAPWLPAGLRRIPMQEAAGTAGPTPPAVPAGLPPARVGMVLFTSGSTGRPKGIALHEHSQARKATQYSGICDMGPRDRLLSLHPPSTNAGMRGTLAALLSGASLHPVDLKRDGLTRALALLRDGGITQCAAAPGVVRAFMAMDGAADGGGGALGRLRVLRLGGDAVTGRDVAALGPFLAPGARVLVGFGLTESGTTIAQRLVDPHAPAEPGAVRLTVDTSTQTLWVEDADGAPVAPGEAGELVVSGRHVALGHWIDGRLDATGFPADPSRPCNRQYRTGDMVRLRNDGTLEPVGRSDRQVKINGMRVEPAETEAALRGLPGVTDAAVIVESGADTPVLVAFVVAVKEVSPAQSTGQRTRDWRSALAARLPPQEVPTRIHVVASIPSLPSLKPDLAALRALQVPDAPTGASRDARWTLAGVWARLRRATQRLPPTPKLPPMSRDDGRSV